MHILSAPGQPYPPLFDHLARLTPDALARMEGAVLPPLRSRLRANYLDILKVPSGSPSNRTL